MGAWSTYRLSDFLLFSPQTYYRLFELYNQNIRPAQIVSFLLGLVILWLLYRGDRHGRWIAAILAAYWLWIAVAFHWLWYKSINWAAAYFAGLFVIEALLLIWAGIIRDRLRFDAVQPLFRRAGTAIFLFALLLQPLIGPLAGRAWTQVQVFGVAPDPTAVGTLGILLVPDHRIHWGLMIMPLLWCIISGATLWAMESPDALLLPVTGGLVLVLAVWKRLCRHR